MDENGTKLKELRRISFLIDHPNHAKVGDGELILKHFRTDAYKNSLPQAVKDRINQLQGMQIKIDKHNGLVPFLEGEDKRLSEAERILLNKIEEEKQQKEEAERQRVDKSLAQAKRAKKYSNMRLNGMTLDAIGKVEGVTRERIRQVLILVFGYTFDKEARLQRKILRDLKHPKAECKLDGCKNKVSDKHHEFCSKVCWHRGITGFDVPIVDLPKKQFREFNNARTKKYYHQTIERRRMMTRLRYKKNPQLNRKAQKTLILKKIRIERFSKIIDSFANSSWGLEGIELHTSDMPYTCKMLSVGKSKTEAENMDTLFGIKLIKRRYIPKNNVILISDKGNVLRILDLIEKNE